MEPGYIVDVMYGHGNAAVPKWVAGEPQRSISTGIKLRGKEQLPVATYRCVSADISRAVPQAERATDIAVAKLLQRSGIVVVPVTQSLPFVDGSGLA